VTFTNEIRNTIVFSVPFSVNKGRRILVAAAAGYAILAPKQSDESVLGLSTPHLKCC
jgi:hypothetical protein